LILLTCIVWLRFTDFEGDYFESVKNNYLIRSFVPLALFLWIEYLIVFDIRQETKLGFRTILSGIKIGLIGLLWFREITEGAGDFYFRNLVAKVIFGIIGVLLFLEVGILFLEKRNHVELFTQLLLCIFKLIFIVSGKELALPLVISLRALLSVKQVCSVLKASNFIKALLIYLLMNLFYVRTSHSDNFYSVNLMDPAIG
jgi:hypothetical protein